MEVGDQIIALDGTTILEVPDVHKCLKGKYSGDKVAVRVLRKGKEMDLEVVLGARE